MKVLSGVHSISFRVTIVTKQRHIPLHKRPNNLSSGIIFEKLCRDRGFDLVVLTMAKFQKKPIQAFLRKLRVKFQGVKIQQKRSYFKSYSKLYPQELTK